MLFVLYYSIKWTSQNREHSLQFLTRIEYNISVPATILKPDLNPIEFIWKSLRKEILKEFIESVTQLRNLIKNEYMKLAKSKSFANNWMKIFDEQIKSVLNSGSVEILWDNEFSIYLNWIAWYIFTYLFQSLLKLIKVGFLQSLNSWVDYILAKEQFSLFLNNFENFYFLINKIFLVLFF